ncbi:putative cellulase [Helianthus annuus]|uniref:cellulase n=1 Tax=Helianthus annuus TaxID=4232 RepID=A0A9K3DJW8_HELAN|nr:putative cellulase [Helianthus annuus]KAJ0430243.1 putative cellulase [Helianthus annuus]KAJ0448669.1 putative cellulase [Helianthus annuus]KAJ0633553.1 putative cellulase [Helianthus annuus]KAJ0637366.1 putative cellulase [Helianthus annuus]
MKPLASRFLVPFLLQLSVLILHFSVTDSSYLIYGEALTKSILFFKDQRSGLVPNDQRMKWRWNSGIGDGPAINADLTGGYYDVDDNVKLGFPVAFTTTMLAWSVIEFGELMPLVELRNKLVAIQWSRIIC